MLNVNMHTLQNNLSEFRNIHGNTRYRATVVPRITYRKVMQIIRESSAKSYVCSCAFGWGEKDGEK